jgi:hypothetical protein
MAREICGEEIGRLGDAEGKAGQFDRADGGYAGRAVAIGNGKGHEINGPLDLNCSARHARA